MLNVTIHHEVFDSLPWPAPSRHLFIDVEPAGAGWALVVRGQDKFRIGHGQADNYRRAQLVWNEPDGSCGRFILATSRDSDPLTYLAEGLIRFYRSTFPLGDRTAQAAGNPALPILLTRFGAHDYVDGNPSQ